MIFFILTNLYGFSNNAPENSRIREIIFLNRFCINSLNTFHLWNKRIGFVSIKRKTMRSRSLKFSSEPKNWYLFVNVIILNNGNNSLYSFLILVHIWGTDEMKWLGVIWVEIWASEINTYQSVENHSSLEIINEIVKGRLSKIF